MLAHKNLPDLSLWLISSWRQGGATLQHHFSSINGRGAGGSVRAPRHRQEEVVLRFIITAIEWMQHINTFTAARKTRLIIFEFFIKVQLYHLLHIRADSTCSALCSCQISLLDTQSQNPPFLTMVSFLVQKKKKKKSYLIPCKFYISVSASQCHKVNFWRVLTPEREDLLCQYSSVDHPCVQHRCWEQSSHRSFSLLVIPSRNMNKQMCSDTPSHRPFLLMYNSPEETHRLMAHSSPHMRLLGSLI